MNELTECKQSEPAECIDVAIDKLEKAVSNLFIIIGKIEGNTEPTVKDPNEKKTSILLTTLRESPNRIQKNTDAIYKACDMLNGVLFGS